MKRLTKAQWRGAEVYNPHNLCSLGEGKVYISYRPRGDSRSCIVPGWMVHGIGFSTDPTAHWMDYGSKSFSSWGRESKIAAFSDAKAWASAKFGIKSWVRDPFGGWQNAKVFARAVKIAREQLEKGA